MTYDDAQPEAVVNEFLLSIGPALAPLGEQLWVPQEVLSACSSLLAGVRRPRRRASGPVGPTGAIAVTSALAGEGRTTVSTGLAVAQRSEYGRKTMLLDLDGKSDADSSIIGLNAVLEGEATLMDAVSWASSELGVLRSGVPNGGAATLLTRFRSSSVLADLLGAGYSVVADLPPLPPTGAADRVVGMFDTVVMVVRAGSTPLDLVRSSLRYVDQEPIVILNGVSSSMPQWLTRGEGS